MSESRVDKNKWSHKLHQLQKRLFRTDNREHDTHEKDGKRRGQLKKIKDRLYNKHTTK